MSIDPSQVPDPEIHPSSTPDGPSTIPPHSNPMGDPDPEPDDRVDFDPRASNPNSGGTGGLSGDMGVSSGRTGPSGVDPPAGSGIQGTGSKGTAVGQTDGTFDTSATEWDAVDVSQQDVQTDPQPEGSGFANDQHNVDRTVGEPRPQPIADEKSRRHA